MITLFTESFTNLVKLIFRLYDFDRDGKISKEDVKLVLSYIPLTTTGFEQKYKMKFELENFIDKSESQNEIQSTLEKIFKTEYLDEESFTKCIENVNSDIFVFFLVFLYEKRPFSDETLLYYKKIANEQICSPTEPSSFNTENSKLIASPSIRSKFRPSLTISKTSIMQLQKVSSISNNRLDPKKKYLEMSYTHQSSEIKENEADEEAEDLKIIIPDALNNENSNIETKEVLLNYEGYLYKITSNKKLKKMYFKLIHKDLYFLKTPEDKVHFGLHNLSGVFIKEGCPITHDGVNLFTFSVVYPKKVRAYYTENEEEYKKWLTCIRKAIGYEDLYEIYDVKDKIGNGRFGLIRVGLHKAKNRDVAIKIINKKDMSNLEYINVKNEIEIMKVTKHPQILQLYDIIENEDYIYIVMEHCKEGDLFSYLEKRHYKLPEPRVAQIIHRLATAVYFLHEYGIIHRDLKPENILMTDSTDEADIRIFDFCVSKRIGPNEYLTEPVGTLGYMAPEVLLEKPYNKSADIWSIGIITYLLLCGCLPFDDEHSDKEIIRQTLYDPVPYPNSIWKKISNEANLFVDKLLQKDSSKRMSLQEVLEHKWIEKYSQTNLPEKRKNKYGYTFSMYASVDENLSSSHPENDNEISKSKKSETNYAERANSR